MAIAISPDGRKAACAGMDDDHHVSVLDLESGKVITTVKGSKKIIMKIVWTNDNEFVTAGIKLFKYWTLSGRGLTGNEGKDKGYYVSIACDRDSGIVYTGESKGMVRMWRQTSSSKPIILQCPTNKEKGVSVVDSLLVHKDHLLAGTKDGYLYVLDKSSGNVLNSFSMKGFFAKSGV